jgi:uncharacterized membrane protein YqaE (UPF0057 family)
LVAVTKFLYLHQRLWDWSSKIDHSRKEYMKKFKYIIAAITAICIVQGAWAIAPGGALGGGGKAAQAHPQQEGAIVAQPAEAASSLIDIQEMTANEDAPIVQDHSVKPKVEIGTNPTEGQAGTEVDDATFKKVAAEHAKTKSVRQELKAAIRQHRDAVKNNSPDSPVDDALLLYVILAILLPPLAVGLYMNGLTTEFWICLILTLLFYIPGLIYALIVILR